MKKEKIERMLETLPASQQISIFNNFLRAKQFDDGEIYHLDEMDEIFCDNDPYYIACRVHFGDFNPFAPYFTFNGYGNIQSLFEYELSRYIDFSEIADYIAEHNEDFYSDKIREILDEEEEEEEETEENQK